MSIRERIVTTLDRSLEGQKPNIFNKLTRNARERIDQNSPLISTIIVHTENNIDDLTFEEKFKLADAVIKTPDHLLANMVQCEQKRAAQPSDTSENDKDAQTRVISEISRLFETIHLAETANTFSKNETVAASTEEKKNKVLQSLLEKTNALMQTDLSSGIRLARALSESGVVEKYGLVLDKSSDNQQSVLEQRIITGFSIRGITELDRGNSAAFEFIIRTGHEKGLYPQNQANQVVENIANFGVTKLIDDSKDPKRILDTSAKRQQCAQEAGFEPKISLDEDHIKTLNTKIFDAIVQKLDQYPNADYTAENALKLYTELATKGKVAMGSEFSLPPKTKNYIEAKIVKAIRQKLDQYPNADYTAENALKLHAQLTRQSKEAFGPEYSLPYKTKSLIKANMVKAIRQKLEEYPNADYSTENALKLYISLTTQGKETFGSEFSLPSKTKLLIETKIIKAINQKLEEYPNAEYTAENALKLYAQLTAQGKTAFGSKFLLPDETRTLIDTYMIKAIDQKLAQYPGTIYAMENAQRTYQQLETQAKNIFGKDYRMPTKAGELLNNQKVALSSAITT